MESTNRYAELPSAAGSAQESAEFLTHELEVSDGNQCLEENAAGTDSSAWPVLGSLVSVRPAKAG